MIKDLVYDFISLMARIHDHALELNDIYAAQMTDKDLHFWFFGVVGSLVFLGAWTLFKWLKNHLGIVAWLFSFVIMLMLALAIEVGQWLTDTGAMELKDIAAGMIGFVAFSLVVGVVFGAIGLLLRLARRRR